MQLLVVGSCSHLNDNQSSLNTTNSTFTKNSAADNGGVMYASESSFDISNSNNDAADNGGIMAMHIQ